MAFVLHCCVGRTQLQPLLEMIEISILHAISQLREMLCHVLSSECPTDRGYPRQ
jgi:hypothetical protein